MFNLSYIAFILWKGLIVSIRVFYYAWNSAQKTSDGFTQAFNMFKLSRFPYYKYVVLFEISTVPETLHERRLKNSSMP
jgi:hypothetical protein